VPLEFDMSSPPHGHGRLDDLTPALYAALHRLAARHLRGERRDHTLQTTALLHEAYLKLSDEGDRRFSDRTHFLAVASRAMRQVLIDHARARVAAKRGGGRNAGEQIHVVAHPRGEPLDVLRVHQALESIAREDEALAHLAELRYFGGMTSTEIASALNRSIHAVRHDLRYVQAWLRRELSR
jgi:RNA polymerase sigma-70 factor, ECF subfamily